MNTTDQDKRPEEPAPGKTPSRTFGHIRPRQQRNLFYRIFRENIGIKVLSLVIAIVLFAMVRTERGNEAEIEIPVQLTNISEDLIFVGEMPAKIKVLVRYKWSRPKRENQPQPYKVDLRGFETGKVFVFDSEVIRTSLDTEGISIVSIYPPEFTVEVEPNIERTIKVRLNMVGQAERGYDVVVEDARAVPDVIRVRGAKSALKDIDFFATYPIDISRFRADVILDSVPVQKPPSKFIQMDTESVRVEIPVREISGQKTMPDVEINVRNCPEGYVCTVTPPTTSVEIEGPLPSIFKIENGQENLEVFVDAAMFDSRVERHQGIKLGCARPVGLRCTETPKSVQLTIQRGRAETQP